jgi:hypothetical protein
MDTEYEAKTAEQYEGDGRILRRSMESIDDRTPLEAGIVRLDELLAKLDHVGREHAERLAPILRPVAEDGGAALARPSEAVSERVSQVHHLADRLEESIDALQRLTARVEA